LKSLASSTRFFRIGQPAAGHSRSASVSDEEAATAMGDDAAAATAAALGGVAQARRADFVRARRRSRVLPPLVADLNERISATVGHLAALGARPFQRKND